MANANTNSEVFAFDFDIDPSAALCPAGTHDAKVIHVEAGPAKRSDLGTQIIVTFEVMNGAAKGRQVKKWYFTAGNPSVFLMRDLRAFGIDDTGKVKLSQKTFLGKKVKIVVVHGKNETTGEDQANVNKVLPFNATPSEVSAEVTAKPSDSAALPATEPVESAENDEENPF